MANSSETTQEAATRPRAETPDGVQLDRWGLPIAGPLRAAALVEAGKPDPDLEPAAWKEPAERPLTKLNKADLLVAAAAEAVEVPEGATNAAIIAAIEARRAATTQNDDAPAGEAGPADEEN